MPGLLVVCSPCHAQCMLAVKFKTPGKPDYTCFYSEFLNGFFIFSPGKGPYSLNGYRVRVYRQDSATQWFTGIITHHDLFTRTMVVMNDQVSLIWKQVSHEPHIGNCRACVMVLWNTLTYSVAAGQVLPNALQVRPDCVGQVLKTVLQLNLCAMRWLIPVPTVGLFFCQYLTTEACEGKQPNFKNWSSLSALFSTPKPFITTVGITSSK